MSSTNHSWRHHRKNASIARRSNDLKLAQSYLEQAIECAKQSEAPPEEVAVMLNALAEIHILNNEMEGALLLAKEGLCFCEQKLSVTNPLVANATLYLARVHELRNEIGEAIEASKRGCALYERAFGTSHPETENVRLYISRLIELQ